MTLTFEGHKVHIDNQGYPRIWIKRLLMVHRVVYARAHGPIPKGMDIHHKDFNKLNWSLDNLVLLSHHDHMQVHRRQALLEKGINPDTHALCWKCKEALPLDQFSKDASRGNGLARECKGCMQRYSAQYLLLHGERKNAEARAKYALMKLDPDKMARRRERDRINARERYRRLHGISKI